MSSQVSGHGAAQDHIYVTLAGLPLKFHLEWPFHTSTSGADFSVLHADIELLNSAGLHSPVAVNVSATVREVMPSLEPKDAESPVINALRKEVDRRQLEFLKSGKLVPVHFSSRYWDFNRDKWVFGKAADDQIALLLTRKAFWQTRARQAKVWLGDPTEALYVESSPGHVLEIARKLQSDNLIVLDGEWASSTQKLMDQADGFESDRLAALEELEKKHAYERG